MKKLMATLTLIESHKNYNASAVQVEIDFDCSKGINIRLQSCNQNCIKLIMYRI